MNSIGNERLYRRMISIHTIERFVYNKFFVRFNKHDLFSLLTSTWTGYVLHFKLVPSGSKIFALGR